MIHNVFPQHFYQFVLNFVVETLFLSFSPSNDTHGSRTTLCVSVCLNDKSYFSRDFLFITKYTVLCFKPVFKIQSVSHQEMQPLYDQAWFITEKNLTRLFLSLMHIFSYRRLEREKYESKEVGWGFLGQHTRVTRTKQSSVFKLTKHSRGTQDSLKIP